MWGINRKPRTPFRYPNFFRMQQRRLVIGETLLFIASRKHYQKDKHWIFLTLVGFGKSSVDDLSIFDHRKNEFQDFHVGFVNLQHVFFLVDVPTAAEFRNAAERLAGRWPTQQLYCCRPRRPAHARSAAHTCLLLLQCCFGNSERRNFTRSLM